MKRLLEAIEGGAVTYNELLPRFPDAEELGKWIRLALKWDWVRMKLGGYTVTDGGRDALSRYEGDGA